MVEFLVRPLTVASPWRFEFRRMAEDKSPDPVDIHVGRRLRMRRKDLGYSQQALADALGLTFQQVQKYEGGSNRISASKLHGAAMFLKTPVAFFFEGLEDPEGVDGTAAELANEMASFWSLPGGPDLARAFSAIESVGMRKHLLDLARAIAGQE
ncbi:XRE family transcriptional regulator [Caulobacter vibrioides]|nr:XRE family transcriptional regulator [Caulobacter vibrioides]AZH13741.1 XRE family transcriptional regulator [Caulobacter vibrioides]PLR07722.1 XRE family transcriptional regulator [Caulobacter vibrioides]